MMFVAMNPPAVPLLEYLLDFVSEPSSVTRYLGRLLHYMRLQHAVQKDLDTGSLYTVTR